DSSQITKSVNLEGDGEKKAEDTMGMKHRVQHGAYVFYGSMNTQLAKITHFSDEDVKQIKEAIRTLFVNDESSARPGGSMQVFKVYWWEHNNPTGQYSTAQVHNAVRSKVKVNLRDGTTEPKDMGDYVYPSKEDVEKELPGLKCEVFDGE
ncbi:MAG: type I CRISPR-associated protein Cas7, partial [Chloroflexi bacterium]|nr:type I CRISPR-associated protein Cas7 [Chloroflexota bacterium]